MIHDATTLLDLLRFDNTLFDNIELPGGLDKDMVIYAIEQRCITCQLIYPEPLTFKFLIEKWFKRHKNMFGKMYNTTIIEGYSPIENYYMEQDSNRNINDTRNLSKTGNETENDNTHYSGTSTTTTEVSAYNASDYQPDNKVTTSITSDNDRDLTRDTKDVEDESYKRADALDDLKHGRTDSAAALIEKERQTNKWDFYEWLASLFEDDFCIVCY